MELKGIILTVSLLCNVWFILLLLQEQIKETKLVRFLCGISELWKSMAGNPPSPQKEETEISKEIPDVIGKSKFKMSVAKSTAATPVPKDSTSEKGVEMSENDITFESENKDSEQETNSARIPDEKLDEAFKSLSPDELGYSDDEPEEENDRPRASGFSFDEIGEAVHIATKKNPSGKEQQKAREVFAELEDTELYEKLMAGSTEISIRIKGLMEIRLKKPKKDFVIPDKLEDFNIRDYV